MHAVRSPLCKTWESAERSLFVEGQDREEWKPGCSGRKGLTEGQGESLGGHGSAYYRDGSSDFLDVYRSQHLTELYVLNTCSLLHVTYSLVKL